MSCAVGQSPSTIPLAICRRVKAAMPRSISGASRTLIALTSIPTDGATDSDYGELAGLEG